jgi:NYN domain-containing protein
MGNFFPHDTGARHGAMVFVDGENLAIRYGNMLKAKNSKPTGHVFYQPDVFVWSTGINNVCLWGGVIRKYYYTSVIGDGQLLTETEDNLKRAGLEAPKVFKKTKTRGSKRVDISLAADMLTHASRRNYEIAILVAGDEDYVPLVEAVKIEGRRVFVWFLEDGLSPVLRRIADRYTDLGEILFAKEIDPNWK